MSEKITLTITIEHHDEKTGMHTTAYKEVTIEELSKMVFECLLKEPNLALRILDA